MLFIARRADTYGLIIIIERFRSITVFTVVVVGAVICSIICAVVIVCRIVYPIVIGIGDIVACLPMTSNPPG